MSTAPHRQAYIAGSYSAPTDAQIRDNIADALRAGLQLARLGWFPIVPHSSGSHRVEWAEAMVRCRRLIRDLDPGRDALVLLPGWQLSKGAREERAMATALGVPVRDLAEVAR